MKKIILTKGLPASGKSTWAKEMVDKYPGQYKRVNKDDLRSMIDNGKWSRDNEKFILDVRDAVIIKALEQGKHVIVDDTNLHQKHIDHMQEIIRIFKPVEIKVEIKDFTDVSLEECIRRDQRRANYVGEKVIRQMWSQFLRPNPPVIEYDPKLPNAVVIDVDGTLALFGNANPYDRDFSQDKINEAVRDIVLFNWQAGRKIILLSGRADKFRQVTEEWLKKNQVGYNVLYMRKTDDTRKDYIIKKEIYDEYIKNKYNVLFVIDDRKQVKRMWVENGLFVFDVNQTDEDF